MFPRRFFTAAGNIGHIIMRIGSFGYLAKQGWKSMAANRLMTFASIGVLTACLIITGLATLISLNVGNIIDYFGDQNEIIVYLEPEVSPEQAQQMLTEIEAMPNILKSVYISQADALVEMKEWMEQYAALLDDYWDALPSSFRVTVSDLNFIKQTEQRLSEMAGVQYTRAPTELASVMVTIKNAVNFGGWALVIVLALVSMIVISNTIRITVFARRREISIMKYVGATNTFIRMPFFVEGVTVGIIAGVLAAGVVCGAYYLIMDFIVGSQNIWFMSFYHRIIPFDVVWPKILMGFLAFGAVVGGLGTTSSMRKHLKV